MKTTMTRRILATLLTLALVLTLVPAAFAAGFTDVPAGAWYEEDLNYCFEHGLMQGTGENIFNPNGVVSREQVVQTLYALAGEPAVTYEARFTDVPDGAWFTDAVIWAAKVEVASGYDTGKFGVADPVTREQVAMFFYSYGAFVGLEEDFSSLNSFPDNKDVSSWATTAVQWAVAMGILSGKGIDGQNYLKPKDSLTRAELASILARFAPIAPEACNHENTEIRGAVEATCTEAGYTGDTYCKDCERMTEKGEEIKPLGHIDEDGDKFCDRCSEWIGADDEKVYTLGTEIKNGMEVVIYNPGHGMAIKNETDNDWYLVPETITPADNKIVNPDASLVWTVVDNGNGTVSFVNGDNKIMCWVSGTYFELTNNAAYTDANGNWKIISADAATSQFYIQHESFSSSYGPAYIECFYNANKDKTNIAGYAASESKLNLGDFGFQFYAFGKATPACEHNWVAGTAVAATCTEEGYTPYTCSKCNATKQENIVPALGHVDAEPADGKCDRCGADMGTAVGDFVLTSSIKDGDEVVIYNPGHGMAIKNETDNNWYLVPEVIAPADDKIASPDSSLVWTVVDNGNGTVSFVNGSNKIMCWVSGNYFELTNDAAYADANGNWKVISADAATSQFFIQHESFSNSYGPAYIECFYNANKNKTNISGYSSGNPGLNDFGFQFYAKGGEACEHNWVAGTVVAATCTTDGYTPYTCSKCGATKQEAIAAFGHNYVDGVCDNCGAIESTSGEGFVLATELNDGDRVIIVNKANNKALSSNYNGFYNAGVDVNPVDGEIADPADEIIWTVGKDGDNYTFSFGGQKLAMGASYSSMPLGEVNDKWTISAAPTVEDAFFILNVGRNLYMEWYDTNDNWSGYGNTSNEALFAQQFYVEGGEVCEHNWVAGAVVAATCTTDGYTPYTCSKCGATKQEAIAAIGHNYVDGVCDNCGAIEPTLGETFTLAEVLDDGDQLLIYYVAGKTVLANTLNGNKVNAVAATVVDNTIAAPEGAGIFTVEYAEDSESNFYLITEDGKYFTSAAAGNSVSFEAAASDLGLWYLVPVTGGYHIMNLTAAYNGNANQALEYYNGFTTYGVKDTDAYLFQLYTIPAVTCEHNFVAGTPVAATCTTAGYTPYTCSLCNKTKNETTAEALGHDWVADPATTAAPTCILAGVNGFKCSRCTEAKTETGAAALGHTDSDNDNLCDLCGKDMTAAGYTVATSIEVGDKIIIAALHDGTNYAVVGVAGASDTKANNALSARAITLDGNSVAAESVDETAIVWEVVAGSAEGTYTLKASDGKYMTWSAGSTTMKTAATGSDFTITCGAGNATLMNTEDRGVSFRNNQGIPQFRMYKSSNNSGEYSWALTIYKLG